MKNKSFKVTDPKGLGEAVRRLMQKEWSLGWAIRNARTSEERIQLRRLWLLVDKKLDELGAEMRYC